MSINSTLPEALTVGRTWTLLSGNYVLKTIASGTGGTESAAGNTGTNSGNTSGASATTTSGPSDNNTSSVTLTAAQSGCPAHGHGNTLTFTTPKLSHTITQPAFKTEADGKHAHNIYVDSSFHPATGGSNSAWAVLGSSSNTISSANSSTHSHTVTRTTNVAISDHAAAACTKGGSVSNSSASNATSGHSHTLNNHTHTLSHTHTLNGHAHTAGMPANIGVYVWKRTA